MEILITTNKSVCVIGQTMVGKSAYMREILFNQIYQFSFEFMVEHLPMAKQSRANQVKRALERRLEIRSIFDTKPTRPQRHKKLILFIEDLNMPYKDAYGI